jgi:FkbM family methyltransferase
MRKDFKEDTWTKFNEIVKTENKYVYLFGAGNRGRELLNKCRNYSSSWKIKGFIDNDKSKIDSEIDGLKVYGIDELLNDNSDRYVVLITNMYPGVIANQLNEHGIGNYWSSLWMDDHMHDFLRQTDIDTASIEKLKSILSDEESKKLVDKLIEKRKSGFMDYTDVQSTGSEYFIDDFFTKHDDEVFIDCGGYDGDTIEEFGIWTENKFKAVYSFEPDELILEKMRKNMYKYDDRVHIIPKGVWSHKTRLSFENTDGMYSGHITNENNKQMSYIECVSLDEVLNDEKVTFIKMDIEGAEIPALLGAKNIILRDKPKLAICIYHKPNDLWEIPLMLKEWVPEYDMHIRHFGRRYYSTILYAYISI